MIAFWYQLWKEKELRLKTLDFLKRKEEALSILEIDNMRDSSLLEQLYSEQERARIVASYNAEKSFVSYIADSIREFVDIEINSFDPKRLEYVEQRVIFRNALSSIVNILFSSSIEDFTIPISETTLSSYRERIFTEDPLQIALEIMEKEVVKLQGNTGNLFQKNNYYIREINGVSSSKEYSDFPVAEALENWKQYTNQTVLPSAYSKYQEIKNLEKRSGRKEDLRNIMLYEVNMLRLNKHYEQARNMYWSLLTNNDVDENDPIEIARSKSNSKLEEVRKEAKDKLRRDKTLETVREGLERRKTEMISLITQELIKAKKKIPTNMEEIVSKQIDEKVKACEEKIIADAELKLIFQHIDRESLSHDPVKDEAYRALKVHFDMNESWFFASDEDRDELTRSILVDGFMIAVSGGISFGVKTAFLESSLVKSFEPLLAKYNPIVKTTIIGSLGLTVEGTAFHTASSTIGIFLQGAEAFDHYWEGVLHSIGMFGFIKLGKKLPVFFINKGYERFLSEKSSQLLKQSSSGQLFLIADGTAEKYLLELAGEIEALSIYGITPDLLSGIFDFIEGKETPKFWEDAFMNWYEGHSENLQIIFELRIGGRLFGPIVQRVFERMSKQKAIEKETIPEAQPIDLVFNPDTGKWELPTQELIIPKPLTQPTTGTGLTLAEEIPIDLSSKLSQTSLISLSTKQQQLTKSHTAVPVSSKTEDIPFDALRTIQRPALQTKCQQILNQMIQKYLSINTEHLSNGEKQNVEYNQRILREKGNIEVVVVESAVLNASHYIYKGIIYIYSGLFDAMLKHQAETGILANWDTIAFITGHELAHLLYKFSETLPEKERRKYINSHHMENECDRLGIY